MYQTQGAPRNDSNIDNENSDHIVKEGLLGNETKGGGSLIDDKDMPMPENTKDDNDEIFIFEGQNDVIAPETTKG